MLLVADVGNTKTVLAAFEGDSIVRRWRLPSEPGLGAAIGPLVEGLAFEGFAVCSVVPALEGELPLAPRFFDPGRDPGIEVRVDPRQVGPDRVVNCLAVRRRHRPPFVVVDLGTATTFDCVDADGAFVGGAIAPGMGIAADALATRTARLPRIEVAPPPVVIGRDTVSAIRAGVFWGYVGLVDGLVRRCRTELGGDPVVVATGGLASLVAPACAGITEIDPDLTLHGLRLWYRNE